MKKFVQRTIVLFFLAIIVANMHRIFNASKIEYIKPFIAYPNMPISKHWYWLFIGELVSYSFVWLWVCFTLNPVINHLKDINSISTRPYLVFLTLWHNIFWVCFFASVLDTLHYLIGFKMISWWFIVQNSVFLIISSCLICKSYFKKWPKKKTYL